MNKKVALIIGAGPAGLTAAYKLLKETDIHPIIIEETPDIGGISKTVEYHGNRIDIGGHRFFSKDKQIMDLWQEIMPLQGALSYDDYKLNRQVELKKDGPRPEVDENVMLIRHRVSRIFYLRKFFNYPVTLNFKTLRNMGFFRTFKAGFTYLGACLHKRQEINLENFYINRFGKSLYKMFFKDYTTKVWGRSPTEIDASWGAQRVKGLSLRKTLSNAFLKPFRKKNNKVETSLIEQFFYPKKGPGQLYEEMAKRIIDMGGEIHLNTTAKNINIKNKKVISVSLISNNKSETLLPDYVFSSMPLKDLILNINKDVTSERVRSIASGLIYRDFITVGLLLKKMSLVNNTKIKTLNNMIPDTWIYIQEPDVKLGRVQIFNNWSPYMVKDVENTVWIGLEYFVNEGDEMWIMNDKDFIKMAIEEISSIKMIDKNDVLDAVEIKIKKAYPAYFDSYKDISEIKEYVNSIDNLFCIGRNGQHRYNNMDHSMLTAIEAVNYIKGNQGITKNDIWNVNTEKEYHEIKKN